ncbi:MAG: DNA polymerase I [bacterium]|nr:DNA polymerase I [bacterium]
MAKKREKFIVIDGNSVIHRAFHAMPPLATKDGTIVNALYGFLNILFKVIKELKPTYIAIAFDVKGKTFRHEMYKEYKGTRKEQAPELYAQIPMVREAVETFGIKQYGIQGFEADDLIGTIAHEVPDTIDTFIVTSDMDALQLVNEHTFIYAMRKGVSDTVTYDATAVQDKYSGLGVDQMIDYKALRGDSSDNIPGVKGIGEKGAIALLTKYKTVENVLKHVDEITGATQQKLIAGEQDAKLSKELATIKCDVPIGFSLEENRLQEFDQEAVVKLIQKYEFKSLLKQVTTLKKESPAQSGLFSDVGEPAEKDYLKDGKYEIVDDKKSADNLVAELAKQGIFAFDTETTSLDPLQCELVGFSICWQEGKAYYITGKYIKQFAGIFADKKIKKIAHNAKFDIKVLSATNNVVVENLFYDTMLASYVLSPGSRGHSLDSLAITEFGYQMMPYEALVGKGKKAISIQEVPLDKLAYYAAEDADYTWRLYQKLKSRVQEADLENILEIEISIAPILAEMELAGISINIDYLKKMSKSLEKDIEKIEKDVYKLAGEEFNIASPKQLKVILFDSLKIDTSGLARTKSGFSTAAPELEKMRDRHPIIDLISEYRELAKLKSTYVDALPKLVDSNTKRIHTNYNQVITATGRLSSSDPNLQNIPIRTELGRKIRKAFVAPAGKVLLSLDYSQVELRIVAHMVQDDSFVESFRAGTDIHTRTAAELNEVSEEEVTKEMRRDAKSVNFGILYGMGAFGLARDSGMTNYDARDYLDKYFLKHPAVKDYIEDTKELARKQGYVESLLGRKRYLPDVNSGMAMVRAAAERAAINMPVQGTASDIMKLAMIKVAEAIAKKEVNALMLLQVHDELVFEVDEKKVKETAKQIKQIMENVYHLDVPLIADVAAGKNWQDLEKLEL